MPPAPGISMHGSKWRWMRCAVRRLILPIAVLSGGEKRRVALCRLLLLKPDILLLDEPTNHLDAESVAWLERHIKEYEGTVIAVTHDRYFLDNVAGWILELDRGAGIPWEGNYSSWLEQKQTAPCSRKRSRETDRQKTLQRELEWIRMSPKGRQAKGKARINSYEALLSQESEKRRRRIWRSLFRQARGWDRSSLKPTGREESVWRQSAVRRTWSFVFPPAASSASSVPMAQGRRRCSA